MLKDTILKACTIDGCWNKYSEVEMYSKDYFLVVNRQDI